MKEYLKKVVKPLKKHKKITGVILVAGLFLASFLIAYSNNNSKFMLEITPYSSVTRDAGRTVFSLNTNSNYLFRSNKKGLDAAKDFISKNPSIGNSGSLFPSDYSKNSQVVRRMQDKDDPYLKRNGIVIYNEHYFFNQSLDGIPISYLNMQEIPLLNSIKKLTFYYSNYLILFIEINWKDRYNSFGLEKHLNQVY